MLTRVFFKVFASKITCNANREIAAQAVQTSVAGFFGFHPTHQQHLGSFLFHPENRKVRGMKLFFSRAEECRADGLSSHESGGKKEKNKPPASAKHWRGN